MYGDYYLKMMETSLQAYHAKLFPLEAILLISAFLYQQDKSTVMIKLFQEEIYKKAPVKLNDIFLSRIRCQDVPVCETYAYGEK